MSDVHYSRQTLEIADKATRLAIGAANSLGVRLMVPGDLHDTKGALWSPCVDRMIETLSMCSQLPLILIGNHDKINEKSDEHALKFLLGKAILINSISYDAHKDIVFVPYHHDVSALRMKLNKTFNKDKRIVIMHQGVQSSNAGHYYQDPSALTKNDLSGLRVISGHYHARQSFDLPNGGHFDFVGNPYSLNFGEAGDPPKGYQILYDDGSLKFVTTNLRRHYIMEVQYTDLTNTTIVSPGNYDDILWVKVTGTKEQLSTLSKKKVAHDLIIQQDFKLDLISLDTKAKIETKNVSKSDMLDGLIDSLTNTSIERKTRLKALWKGL